MLDRVTSFAKRFSTAIHRLGGRLFGEEVPEVAKNVGDPQGPQQETGLEPNDQRPARDFLQETKEALKEQWELSSKGLGGAALEAEKKVNEFVDTLGKTRSVVDWAGRLKALAGIGAAAFVAVLAGVHVAHFDRFDHPLAPPSSLAKDLAVQKRLQELKEISQSLDRMPMSPEESDAFWRNLEDRADRERRDSLLLRQVDVTPEVRRMSVQVTLSFEGKTSSYSTSGESIVASYPTRELQSEVNSQLEKAATTGTTVEVHWHGVWVPTNVPPSTFTGERGPPATGKWEIYTTTEVKPKE